MKPFSQNETIKAFLYLHSTIKTTEEAQEVINALEEWRPNWQNLRNMYFERVFPQVFISYALACLSLKDYDGATKILEEGIMELSHRDFKYYFGEKATIYDLLVNCYVANGDINKAYEAALEKIFNLLYASNNLHFDNFEFYAFRSFSEFALKDLENETLSLCSPSLFNDPVDTPLFPWIHYQKEDARMRITNKEALKNKLAYLDVMEKAYDNIRVRCLVRNIMVPHREGRDSGIPLDSDREYANTLMWAHYANNHTGFCVKYVLPSAFTTSSPNDDEWIMLRPLTYVDTFPLIDDFGNIRNDITFYEAMLTKQKKWEYEHEHRLLYFNRKGSPDYPTPKLPVGSIKAVYIGVRASEKDKQRLFDALKDRTEVEVYQMQISSKDMYRLVAQKIQPIIIKKDIV